MKLPGHAQLHREIHLIREIRKEVFAVQKMRRDLEQSALLLLFRRLTDGLKNSAMTIPLGTLKVEKEALLAETASLLRERESRVDSETQEKRNENFKELSKRLQGSFNMGGARTMKVVTGKMGGSRGMWGVHTDHPDCVHVENRGPAIQSDHLSLLLSSGRVQSFCGDKLTTYQASHLRDMLPLVTECFRLAPDRTSWSCSEQRI
eukprot:2393663-Rhodomonas_salina.1